VFLALVIQHANRMRRVMLSSAACLILSRFSHYLINRTIFGGKKTLPKIKYVLCFSPQNVCKIFSF